MKSKAGGGLLLSYALLSSACAPVPASSGGAVMFLGDTAHTGVFPVPDLPSWKGLLWSVRLDGPIRGSPTVRGDLIHVASASGTVAALEGWWLSSWSADTAGVTVLARDSDGRAASWREGGFVRLLGSAAARDGLGLDLLRAI